MENPVPATPSRRSADEQEHQSPSGSKEHRLKSPQLVRLNEIRLITRITRLRRGAQPGGAVPPTWRARWGGRSGRKQFAPKARAGLGIDGKKIDGPEKFYGEVMDPRSAASPPAWPGQPAVPSKPGKDGSTLTGQLGRCDESGAGGPLPYLRAKSGSGLPSNFLEKTDIHHPLPRGRRRSPSSPPSVSLLTGIRVRGDTSMTGALVLRWEASRRRCWQPAGRASSKSLPERNRKDVLEVPEQPQGIESSSTLSRWTMCSSPRSKPPPTSSEKATATGASRESS